jgi:hypothetical protein
VVASKQKHLQVLIEFIGGLLMEALDINFFDGAVHTLDLI